MGPRRLLGLVRAEPALPGFGATRFHTGDISGHSSYFSEGSESLRNIGLITAGYLDEVNVNDGVF